MKAKKAVLEMKNICKSFNGNPVLKNVDYTVYESEIVALMGGNGAGKSTLMKILNGVYQADQGEIRVGGKTVSTRGILDARAQGIGMIFQEFSLISTLTVAENIFLTHEPKKKTGMIDNEKCAARAKEILDRLGIDIDPRERVENLSVGYRQIVEIAKTLSFDIKILDMDEPTSALTERETKMLFDIVRNLVRSGISVVFISHRMKEIYQLCDRITVLRDGVIVLDDACSNVPIDNIVQYIVGTDMNKKFEWVPRKYSMDCTPVLEVKHLRYKDRVKDVSFKLYESEILGIAGLMGSGRSETLQSIFGLLKPENGEIYIEGERCQISKPMDAIRRRIALIPESRRVQGLVVEHSVKENMIVTILDKLRKGLFLNDKKADQIVRDQIELLNIKTDGMNKKICYLSGGNQQKVVISKWLANESKILMMDEPTVGVDIGAKTEIIHVIRQLADAGNSILIVSSELNELLAVADRILVFKDGHVIHEMKREEIENEEVLQHAIQGYQ